MGVKCPNCGYRRKSSDIAAPWQCPSCNVPYGKIGPAAPSPAVEPATRVASAADAAQAGIRTQGLKMMSLGVVGALLFTAAAYALQLQNYSIHGFGWGVPGAYALAGLVQCVSGVPFTELSTRWDELRGWQRGVLGLLIVCIAFCVLIAGMALFA